MPDPQLLNTALEHQRLGRFDDAEDLYRRIIAEDANHVAALTSLSDILMYTGRIEEAVETCRKASALDPANPQIHSNLCYKLRFYPDCDASRHFAEDRRWNERHARRIVESKPARSTGKRIRVGFVSPDFYGHAECFFIIPLLKSHDRNRLEIHCYSSVRTPDKATKLIRAAADAWHDVLHLTDDQLADKIRADKIDILVDLTMHMANNRLRTFAQKPAPIQVTWLAYPGGTGLDAIDYRLTDPYLDPPGQTDHLYAEKSIRLPSTWCCYHPLGDVPPAAPPDTAHITFGCLNNPCKLNQPTLTLWAKTVAAVPGSRILILSPSERQRRQINEIFAAHNVQADRIDFIAHQRRGEYLRLYDRIDIALDPLIYNGITTTCDALWMGVPVVTRVGFTPPARAGLSILSNINLPNLIAQTDEQFIQLASQLASDSSTRSHLRATLRSRIQKSSIMDSNSFARFVEAAFMQM